MRNSASVANRHSLIARVTQAIFPKVPDFHGLLYAQAVVVADVLDVLVAYMTTGDETHALHVRALEKEGDLRHARTLDELAGTFSTPVVSTRQ